MNSIRISGLKKSYTNNGKTNNVLQGIDLNIEPGEIVGYIGPNGAGKSTTVKILCGMIEEYEGEVEVFGLPLRENLLEIKARIGFVPENGAVYELLTPREFLEVMAALHSMDKEAATTRIENLAQMFDMTKHLDERMDSFSKGMKQKIMIVSGLLHNPDILFLDEPLSGLDANTVILVKNILKQLAQQGKTIFYSSHLMDVVEKISDRIVLLNNGVVEANGTFEEMQGQNSASLESLFAELTGNVQTDEEVKQILANL